MFYSIGSAKSRPTSEKEDGSPRGPGTTSSSSSLAPENLEREMTPTSTDYMDAIRLANVRHSPSLNSCCCSSPYHCANILTIMHTLT